MWGHFKGWRSFRPTSGRMGTSVCLFLPCDRSVLVPSSCCSLEPPPVASCLVSRPLIVIQMLPCQRAFSPHCYITFLCFVSLRSLTFSSILHLFMILGTVHSFPLECSPSSAGVLVPFTAGSPMATAMCGTEYMLGILCQPPHSGHVLPSRRS